MNKARSFLLAATVAASFALGAVSVTKSIPVYPALSKVKAELLSFVPRRAEHLPIFTDVTARQEIACPAQGPRDAVILAFGQSNAGNHLSRPFSSLFGAVNFFEGRCYVAQDPLLGSTGAGGSVWTLLADELIRSGRFEHVIIVSSGIGSSEIARWSPGAENNVILMRQLAAATKQYTFTHLLWHQGESDYGRTSYEQYKKSFMDMLAPIRQMGIKAPIYVSVASGFCDGTSTPPKSLEIERAQRALVNGTDILAGPDTDTGIAQPGDRWDGCHVSAQGVSKFSRLWAQAIK